nr:MAG TPA: hypothetical protein [Bacteriophage sp.]
MALSLANGCRMWYTLRAGLLAGCGGVPGVHWLATGCALVLYAGIILRH